MKKYLIFIVFIFAMNEIAVSQTIRYVTPDGAGSNDGTSWEDAYDGTQLQTAINELGLTTGVTDEVWIAAGTYYPAMDANENPAPSDSRTKCFQLKNLVAIYGGFAGGESSRSERNLRDNITILSGDIDTPGDNSDNSYHVVYNESIDNTAILDGFTIQQGNANDYYESSGAGMYNNLNSSPTLTNCTFSGNYAAADGGAIFNYVGSNPILSNCLISGNSAANGGGVCNIFYSDPTLNNCTITGNSVSNYGGGVFSNNYSSSMINNSIIYGNTAATSGNQFYMDGGVTLLNNCCYANGSGDLYGTVTSTDCIYSDPRFVNHNTDFRITASSPCVDAGDNSFNSESCDIRGNTRIQPWDGNIDIGAYEYSFPSDPADQKIIYVNSDAIGDDNGSSWFDAYLSLQSALNDATYGYEIWVADGTYTPTIDTSGNPSPADERTKCFQMLNGVAIYGGFAGAEASFNERNWKTNVTILSGDIGSTGDNSDNAYHVIYNLNINTTAVIDGFTIKKGEADGGYGEDSGAGVYNDHSSPTLANCTMSENYAYGNGGGVFNTSSSPKITNCTFSDNDANYGAGIYNEASSPIITNCLIVNNSAMAPGGGVASEGSSAPEFTNCTLSGNTSMAYGGGIFNSSSSLTVINSIIWGNISIGSGNEIFNEGLVPVELSHCCYQNNISGEITILEGCITSDPLFINPDVSDYRISANSPCTDAGYDVYNNETTDIRGPGFSRKLSKTYADYMGTIDMGAYEYKMGTDPDPVMQIIYVDASITSGLFDGTSWDNAYSSLTTALTDAESYSEIWVADGTYKPTADADRSISFHLKNDVAVYGGFAGAETLRSQRNWNVNPAILSGDIGAQGINTDNSYHVIYNYLVNTAILDGFTIQGGNALGSDGYGGGVYNEVSSPTFAHCIISGNNAPVGAGVYNYNYSIPTFSSCLISGNAASGDWGGGMFNYYHSNPTLSNCTLSGNTSTQYGGGMVNNGESSPAIFNSIIWGNFAATSGNQIYNLGSATSMYSTCFANEAGDIFIASGTVTPDAQCLNSDPLFVNAAGNDYRINGNSPCVNRGNNGYSGSAYDVRGQLRIQNTTIDMGAYEWTSGIDPDNVITWTGAVSANWNTAGNWNPAIIPSSSNAVIIPDVLTSDPVVNESPASPAVCHDLIINAGATLKIATGKAIIINGFIYK